MVRWVLFAVFAFALFRSFHGRTNEELGPIGVVDEKDGSVIFWVDVFFHIFRSLGVLRV